MAESWNDDAYYYDDYYDEAPRRTWPTPALFLSGLIGAVIGFACAACLGGTGLAILLLLPVESNTSRVAELPPVPVATAPIPPPPAVAPGPTNPPPQAPPTTPFVSGGLGLTQQEWEQRHGPGSPDPLGFSRYENGIYLVTFQDGKVWQIERQWSPENAITLDDARLQSGEVMPSDRQYIQTYSPEGRPQLVVDLYLSPSLQSRFGPDRWLGGEPGNFTVTYSLYENGVTNMAIAPGNNP